MFGLSVKITMIRKLELELARCRREGDRAYEVLEDRERSGVATEVDHGRALLWRDRTYSARQRLELAKASVEHA